MSVENGSGASFFDTNVLVYAFLPADTRRLEAQQLMSGGGLVSVQVLNEMTSVARGRFETPWEDVARMLQAVYALCGAALAVTHKTHSQALGIARRHGFHIYDACIVASALEADCTTLYSEDMQDGQQIGPLTICNPFTAPA